MVRLRRHGALQRLGARLWPWRRASPHLLAAVAAAIGDAGERAVIELRRLPKALRRPDIQFPPIGAENMHAGWQPHGRHAGKLQNFAG